MEVVAIIVIIIGIWLMLKVVGVLFKLALVAVVLAAAYWLLAPMVGLPPLF